MLFNVFMDKVEDPMAMIDQAKRDMQESLIKNRELAVQAITQKNNLSGMVQNLQAQIERNKAQAGMALKQREAAAPGSPEWNNAQRLALQFAGELQTNQAQLVNLQASHAQATAACENVKKAIEHQETDFRKKLAEAAALKANYKSAQVQNAIEKALSEFNIVNTNEGFGAASEKVLNMQSEAAARAEMRSTSLAGKVAELEDATYDFGAQSALADLEKQLGFTPHSDAVSSTNNNAEDALNQLEQRLGN